MFFLSVSAQINQRPTGANSKLRTYHCDKSILFEQLRNLGKLVLEVVHPDITNVGALLGLSI